MQATQSKTYQEQKTLGKGRSWEGFCFYMISLFLTFSRGSAYQFDASPSMILKGLGLFANQFTSPPIFKPLVKIIFEHEVVVRDRVVLGFIFSMSMSKEFMMLKTCTQYKMSPYILNKIILSNLKSWGKMESISPSQLINFISLASHKYHYRISHINLIRLRQK